MFNYIIYHNRCPDGFGSFWVLHHAQVIHPKAIIHPDMPSASSVPPNIQNKDVIIVDVAYSPKIIKAIANQARSLVYIDHHVTHAKEIKKLKHLNIFYDIKHSAAILTWKYFMGKQKPPYFLKLIEDHDIGKWKLKDSKPFNATVQVNLPMKPKLVHVWDKLLNKKYLNNLIKMGRQYQDYKKYLIRRQFGAHTIIQFEGHKVAIINSSCVASELGHELGKKLNIDFAILWRYSHRTQKYIVMLRSQKVDVQEIAKKYGGGGHKLAAAFATTKPFWSPPQQ